MDSTRIIQTEIKNLMVDCCCLGCEAKSIIDSYWATEANTTVSGLTNDTDAATYSSALTKAEYTNGITFATDVYDFFNNSAVTTTDYNATANKLIYGSAATPTKHNEATEQVGDRLKTFGQNCLAVLASCEKVLQIYSANEIGDMIANLDAYRPIPGSDMNRTELNSGITFVEQFKKMMRNEAVTTGDYATTVASWQHL